MLKKIKTLLNITDDSQNDLLNLLIALCSDEAMAYCNLNHSIPELETPIIYMVVERYNKIGSEGLDNINTNGITENYIINYSDNILNKLKRYRKNEGNLIMVLRDLLLEKEMVEHEDGYGGHTQTLHNAKNIQCKISVNTNPAISNIFGTFDEKILYVWSREALSQNYLYEYKGDNYTVRAQEKNNRFYYSILIEEKPTYTKEGK